MGDHVRAVRARVRVGDPRDPHRRAPRRRACPDRGRRARHRRDRRRDRESGREPGREGRRHRVPDRARVPEGSGEALRPRLLLADLLLNAGASSTAEPGGAGAAAGAGAPLESPGGPGTVAQREEPDEEKTLAEELVEEGPPVEVSPDMGTTRADPGAGGMRFEELVAKRRDEGLSDDEADELGQLMAEREGREWTSTRSLKAGYQPDSA